MATESELRNRLDYEVACAKRYRRFLSLVIMKMPFDQDVRPTILENSIRESDWFVYLDHIKNTVAVLMPETDGTSAKHALERYKKVAGNDVDMRAGIASFPGDAGSTVGLFESAFRSYSQAINSEFGAVVSSEHKNHNNRQ